MDCSLPGSSVHGIFQARVLEWGEKSEAGRLKRLSGGYQGARCSAGNRNRELQEIQTAWVGPLISGPFCVFLDNKPFLERVFPPLRTGLPALLQDVVKRWHLTVEIETLIDFSCSRKRSALCSISWPHVCNCPRGVLPWGELKRQNRTVHWNWCGYTLKICFSCAVEAMEGAIQADRGSTSLDPKSKLPQNLLQW